MLRDLARCSRDPEAVGRLRRILRLGPWFWPADEDEQALAYAKEVTGLERPPEAPSRLPVVTVRGDAATIWLISDEPSAPAAMPGRMATLSPDTEQSWRDSFVVLPRSLPVLWSSLKRFEAPPSLVFVERCMLGKTGMPPADLVVKGPSLGLAFFLFLAARVSGIPLPQDLVPIAALDDSGAVEAVDEDGLRMKIAALGQLAPRVRKLVVAGGQQAEAGAFSKDRFEVIGVRAASEVFEKLNGQVIVDRLIQAGHTEAERHMLLESLLRVALMGRAQCLDWSPIERAAALALESWQGLASDQIYSLEFVRAVAARHQRNQGCLRLPPADWLRKLPRQLRLTVLANLVQQSADVGEPHADDVLQLARPEVPADVSDALDHELGLAGAVARLEASYGMEAVALRKQEGLARAHRRALNSPGVSFPLCEWLRLSGSAGDGLAFDRAVEFAAELETSGMVGVDSRAYIDLAIARGRVMLDRIDAEEPCGTLRRLAGSRGIPSHVRQSAARWTIECLRKMGEPSTELEEAKDALKDACPPGDADGAIYLDLAELDDALASGDGKSIERIVKRLSDSGESLAKRLLQGDSATDSARHLVLHYPY